MNASDTDAVPTIEQWTNELMASVDELQASGWDFEAFRLRQRKIWDAIKAAGMADAVSAAVANFRPASL